MICRVILISESELKQKRNLLLLSVCTRYCSKDKRNYICKILNAIIIQCNLKGNYKRKSKSYTKLKYTTYLQT